jgi:hypothetical protein
MNMGRDWERREGWRRRIDGWVGRKRRSEEENIGKGRVLEEKSIV